MEPDKSSDRPITDNPPASVKSLEKENAELRRSNGDLEDFAGTAAHDLLAPLRAITQMAQVLEKEHGGDLVDEAHELIQSMIRSTKRMKLLTDDLLQYAKISSDLPLATKQIPAHEALEEALENLKEDIQETAAVITHDELPSAELKSLYLLHIFQNLVANALAYRREEPPKVHISAYKESTRWLFCVSDNGMGIDEKYYDKIFEPFKRLQGSQIPGTGLGLAVCRKAIERVGGKIWVSSRVGEGSRFYFTIPT